jgi:hypothetical protein
MRDETDGQAFTESGRAAAKSGYYRTRVRVFDVGRSIARPGHILVVCSLKSRRCLRWIRRTQIDLTKTKATEMRLNILKRKCPVGLEPNFRGDSSQGFEKVFAGRDFPQQM